MTKGELLPATIEEFFYWINERHQIYVNRFGLALEKPWTEDKIFQQFKFTNVFRQLDTGTIALDMMLGDWFNSKIPLEELDLDDAINILFNVVWYRMFNLADHAIDVGFTDYRDHKKILEILMQKKLDSKKVFTSAHMTTGTGETIAEHGKIYGHLCAAVGIAEEFGEKLIAYIFHNQTLEGITTRLCRLPAIGKFIAYEIACDLRFTPLLSGAKDIMTWANMGPGARRGLMRLGMIPVTESMIELYEMALAEEMLEPHVMSHVDDEVTPFELREIEHSLCEFDKYMRVKHGTGRPRQGYDGV